MKQYEHEYLDLLLAYFSREFNPAVLSGTERKLFDISRDAFDSYIHARMSELPIENEIAAFASKVAAAETREMAYNAATDRGDPNVAAVLNAVGKVTMEIHRLMGLLRFSPDSGGVFTARFEPDHFTLPAVVQYFTDRFGETPWAIIDEKRGLCLSRKNGGKASFSILDGQTAAEENAPKKTGDEWEELWKYYHKTINNESRHNPDLQRQFMPIRYRKHLPEV
jgi:probable DNA metabolism protein